MKTRIILACLLCSSALFAAEAAKEAKPVSCRSFNVFKDANGVEVALCAAPKAGGKATLLRSFAVASVVDPETDKPVRVLVGFR